MSAIWAEFEEKEFEIPLYLELLSAPGQVWTPGQVLEHKVGLDCALEATNLYWHRVRRKRKAGVTLQGLFIGCGPLLTTHANAAAGLSFRFNLLIQAKRPVVYPAGSAPRPLRNHKPLASGKRWHCISRDAHQQNVLESLASALASSADVSYAAPAFVSRLDLWKHTRGRTLLDAFSFPLARRLKGHTRFAYFLPGASGFALSEPDEVNDASLFERIRTGYREQQDTGPDQILGELVDFCAAVQRVVPIDRVDWLHRARGPQNSRIAELAANAAATLALNDVVWLVAGPQHT